MQSEINIKVGNKSPKEYFDLVLNQMVHGKLLTGINTKEELEQNLKSNCVPLEIMNMTETDYQDFLSQRRALMANKMKEYYFSL